jgi:hypothetical protein
MTMAHAQGTFTVASWDENTYAELDGNGKLTRATVTFDFAGEVQGQGTWDAVMCYRDDGTAVFTGMQRMVGQIGGRSGGFVLRADGTFAGGEARSVWEVVEGSGTGELAGLRGAGSAVATSEPPGTFSFDYELA